MIGQHASFRFIVFLGLLLFSGCNSKKEDAYTQWRHYAGTPDANRYSSLTQIDTANVTNLQVAWRFSTGDKDTGNRSQIQCNPIVIDGILYGTSPKLKLFAIDAATGQQKWLFDPFAGIAERDMIMGINRGLSYWQDGEDKRIFYAVKDKVYAIDALTGILIKNFGDSGSIDLDEGLDREVADASVTATSPGIIYKDLLIMGGRLSETAEAAPGHIRAYNVRTGKREWIFHTIPHPGEKGFETWQDSTSWKTVGGANAWTGFSLDEGRGIVYVPLGSASYDFYGGNRKGQNLFANCLLALDAATGKYIWHFQTVHHDIWDRDLPATPNLVTVKHNGKEIDAVAQITKTGFVFLLDRVTGKPLFPVREVAAPPSQMPGEATWPTQPVPTLPAPFVRQTFTENDINPYSVEKEKLLQQLKSADKGHLFTPPSKRGTLIFPGFDGGGEWGGAAFDVQSHLLYVNANEMPWILQMIDVPKSTSATSVKEVGKAIYNKYCITCHGADMKGDAQGSFPSLQNLGNKYKESEILTIIQTGRNRMPAFQQIPQGELQTLLAFLLNKVDKELTTATASRMAKTVAPTLPYTSTGYNRMLDSDGYPGIKPPWGTLNAIDLNSGKIAWQVPLGEFEALTQKGIPITGTENYGGPLVTAGGLVFIAATKDEKFRAFNKKNGKLLWQTKLPAAGYATPCTYNINGKQYIVIAAGGGKSGTPSGDEYIAFALPQ